ncbi:MAG: hypothetical protein ACKO9D_03110, partial [Gammaproteobacteria bacterium]
MSVLLLMGLAAHFTKAVPARFPVWGCIRAQSGLKWCCFGHPHPAAMIRISKMTDDATVILAALAREPAG